MTAADRLERLQRMDVELGALVDELAGEPGHRCVMARAQVETAREALARARGFLLSTASSTFKAAR